MCYQSTASLAGRPCCVAATALLARLQAASAACKRASVVAAAAQLDPPAEDAQLWAETAARLRASALLAACALVSAGKL